MSKRTIVERIVTGVSVIVTSTTYIMKKKAKENTYTADLINSIEIRRLSFCLFRGQW